MISLEAKAKLVKMPPGIPYIVSNEAGERFCYYGINTILTLYMTHFLRLGDAEATTIHSLFKSGAYFFPLVGAIVSDMFWGKYRTIIMFSLAYVVGCTILALVPGQMGLLLGLFLIAFGTGGIKPCATTHVGDQFTSSNRHLIERALSYFYLAINAGATISIFLCPVLLKHYGPHIAFGLPAVAMFIATTVFWLGRKKYGVVPPAGAKAWLDNINSPEGRQVIKSLAIIYLFFAFFWALWDQSNGQTWTLQAESSLMNKDLGFGITLLPAQIQVVNGLLILGMVPIFTFVVYPVMGKFFTVTPLRKIGIGLFLVATSFLIVAWIEGQIQDGHVVSAWWQILAYVVLTASEVLVSITGLEFSYSQAPLKMKSFIMSMFLLAVSLGNAMTGTVNSLMVKPLTAVGMEAGTDTWVQLSDVHDIVNGQKIDFGGKTGLNLTTVDPEGKPNPLAGTFLVAAIDERDSRVKLMDAVDRKPVASTGSFNAAKTKVSTYYLIGPDYFLFFAGVMALVSVLFIFVARRYKGQTYVREETGA